MKRLVGTLVVAVLVAAVAWIVASRPRNASEARVLPDGATEETGAARVAAAELAAPETPAGGDADRAVVDEGDLPTDPTAATAPAATSEAVATIRGRFLLPDGEAAAGVALHLRGWSAGGARELRLGESEEWRDPKGASEPDGTFALVFDPPRPFQFVLEAKLDGYCEASWRWSEILPGHGVDVGDVVLVRGGAIEGRIVDDDGNPLPGEGWTVHADSDGPFGVRLGSRGAPRGIEPADPTTGRFRIEDMPPGPVDLKAHHDLASWVDGPGVAVVAGETVEADVVYSGPSFASRIAVITQSPPFHAMSRPEPSSIWLHGGGEPREARPDRGSMQRYTFDDVAPGVYSLVVDDPLYEPWRRENVRPGTRETARLKGSSAVRLDVRDAETGAAVERYALRVAFRNVAFHPREFDVHDGAEPLPGGRYEGLFPGDYRLTVRAEGYGTTAVDFDGLQPGETRSVQVVLGDPTLVTGRVIQSGAPVAHVDVLLLAPAEVDDSAASPILRAGWTSGDEPRQRRQVAAVSTDADGRFELEIAVAGTYVVYTELEDVLRASSDPFRIAQGERRRVDLELPAGGRLTGRIVAADGVALAGMRVWPCPAMLADLASDVAFQSIRGGSIELGADGAFQTGLLPAGEVTVYLYPSTASMPFLALDERRAPAGAVDLGRVTIEAGATVEREFVLEGNEPGSIRLSVRSHGSPVAGAEVTLASRAHAWLQARTDARGEAGPLRCSPDTWHLSIESDAGWSYRHPQPVAVPPGAEVRVDVDVQATEATLTLLDESTDQPLSHREVAVALVAPGQPGWTRHRSSTTDDQGRLTLTLTPGDYRLELDPQGPVEAMEQESQGAEPRPERTATITWPARGPDRTEVRL